MAAHREAEQTPKDSTQHEDIAETYWSIVWGQFKKYRLSYYALYGVIGMILLAIYAPVFALNLPFWMRIAGEQSYPWFAELLNRNYYEGTVDIIFNTLMFIVPFFWLIYLVVSKITASKPYRKRRKIKGWVIKSAFLTTLIVNVLLLIWPVQKPISEARTRWDFVEEASKHLEQAQSLWKKLESQGELSIPEMLSLREEIQKAKMGFQSGVNNDLAGLEKALHKVKVSQSVASLGNVLDLFEKQFEDLSRDPEAQHAGVDLSKAQEALKEARKAWEKEYKEGKVRQSIQWLEQALDLALKEGKKLPRIRILEPLQKWEEDFQIWATALTPLQKAWKRSRSKGLEAALRNWDQKAWMAQAKGLIQVLQKIERDLDAKAIFPWVRYSFRFKTNAFGLPMPWSEGGSWEHPLGTNKQSRDIFAQMIFGTRIALTIGIVAVSIYLFIGVVLGALGGYFGGKIDMMIMRLIEIMLCFPSLFLIMTLAAFIEERSIFHVMLIIGLTRWTGPARLVRGEFLRLRNEEFVQAAKALGLPEWRIIFRHVLPNALGPVLVTATFGVASAILVESTISFLGVGDPSAVTWGGILNQGRIEQNEIMIVLPGLAIFLTVSLFNLMGEGLRDALDPKMRR